MYNVSPVNAVVRRTKALLELAFVLVTGGIFLAILGLALYVFPLDTTQQSLLSLVDDGRVVFLFGGVFAALVGVALGIRAALTRTENDLAYRVGETLRAHLDTRYAFIRNINKRKLGYIDAVLLGPPGVLVFRILDREGKFLNERGYWMRADRNDKWRPTFTNPTREIIDDIKALREFLTLNELEDVPVYGVIVFTKDDPAARLVLKEPVVPATHLSSLYYRLQRTFLAQERIDQQTVIAIHQLLMDE